MVGMESTPMTALLGSEQATAFLSELRSGDAAQASALITAALRSVIEAGDDLDPAEAERGMAAVAVLLAEREPSVLTGAPDADALRAFITELDTELTPARKQAARGVLLRVGVTQQNSWYETRSGQADWPQIQAAVNRLRDLLADS